MQSIVGTTMKMTTRCSRYGFPIETGTPSACYNPFAKYLFTLGIALVIPMTTLVLAPPSSSSPVSSSSRQSSYASSTSTTSYIIKKYSAAPARSVVVDRSGRWIATFTNGSRTVAMSGPERTFAETSASVVTSTYVRLLPAPFSGTVDTRWLDAALVSAAPDLLGLAAQYLDGAPAIVDQTGLQIAGDAGYGPLLEDGTRQEGSDFNDYLGIPWSYGNTVDKPESAQFRDLDCSGFMRMIFGYRSGIPMTLSPDGTSLPRRSFEMLESAPGKVIYADTGTQLTTFSKLQAGDLVFFDASTDDGKQIDHVGMFLGVDTAGHYRFVSSRKSIDGPTMGDYRGASLLDGTGLYAKAFRAVRRL